MEQPHKLSIVQQVVVATCLAVSLGCVLLGSLCALGGWFVGLQIVVAGACLVAYSIVGFVLAEKLFADLTAFAIRCGLVWSGIGLICIASAALDVVLESKETMDVTGVVSLSIILLVQACNIVGLAILVRQHAKSARW